ncbi:MAG: sensor domain-containing diguanylate cyclase [Pseudomonadota bacterium]
MQQEFDRHGLIRLFERYRSHYSGSPLSCECGQRHPNQNFNQQELVGCLVEALVDDSEEACLALVARMCQANVPFMIVAHEVTFLRDALIHLAVDEADTAAVSSAVTFFDHLMDDLASEFLRDFLKLLAGRNHSRLRHISELTEKNLLVHFEKHLHWMDQLTGAVAERNVAAMPETHPERCEFGKWLHSEGAALIRDKSHFRQIVRVHDSMHHVVQEMVPVMGLEADSLPLYALLKKAENHSLDLGNEISLLNSMVIMSVYSKDALTGLLTRRNLERILVNQLEISRATETPFCLLMCDLDHFKRINDDHGHTVGDLAIVHFAGLVRAAMRQSDLLFRYGGEEFLAVLPATPYDQGRKIAEKLRLLLKDSPLATKDVQIDLRASFGLLEVHGSKVSFIDTELVRELIQECDQRLYLAKHRGRDQIA